MTLLYRSFIILILILLAPIPTKATQIAFGSCLKQWRPQPIWHSILNAKPDALVLLGDNVYADTGPLRTVAEPKRIFLAYQMLGQNPGFKAVRQAIPIFATWDDHDYGRNDAGAEYPWQKASKTAFMKFFNISQDAPMQHRSGIYSAYTLKGPGTLPIQILLLDTRSFRSPLRTGELSLQCPQIHYVPNTDPQSTVLGQEQWLWLKSRLAIPALHILVSSIQVLSDKHCYEKWSNFPHERMRLLTYIREASGHVVLVSGDRHLAEISVLPKKIIGYPLYELTTSGLNSASVNWGEINPYRTSKNNFQKDNFGMIRLEKMDSHIKQILEVRDISGKVVLIETQILQGY